MKSRVDNFAETLVSIDEKIDTALVCAVSVYILQLAFFFSFFSATQLPRNSRLLALESHLLCVKLFLYEGKREIGG